MTGGNKGTKHFAAKKKDNMKLNFGELILTDLFLVMIDGHNICY